MAVVLIYPTCFKENAMCKRAFLKELAERLKIRDELDLVKDVENFIDACGEYVQRVNKMEAASIVSQSYLELKDYRVYKNALDENRRSAHEDLINNLKLLNHYSDMCGMDRIFQGDMNNRIEIGDFAHEIVKELFETRLR